MNSAFSASGLYLVTDSMQVDLRTLRDSHCEDSSLPNVFRRGPSLLFKTNQKQLCKEVIIFCLKITITSIATLIEKKRALLKTSLKTLALLPNQL